MNRPVASFIILGCALLAFPCVIGSHYGAEAATVLLKNGLRLEGDVNRIAGLAENPLNPSSTPGEVEIKPIAIIDDGLRRTFVPWKQVVEVRPDPPSWTERIRIRQRVARKGPRVGAIGGILEVSPFDGHGRRKFVLMTKRGRLPIIQAITEITPVWTKVQGHVASRYVWDMRLATSSIPRDTLREILQRQSGANSPEGRLSIVRLLFESERYSDAEEELNSAIEKFPELAELDQLSQQLRQLKARTLIDEIRLRRRAGQHQLVSQMLTQFPSEGVAGETLQQVRELLQEYETTQEQVGTIVNQLPELAQGVTDEEHQQLLAALLSEIATELSANNLDHMADYLRLAEDTTLTPQQRLSLAISGWLLGSGSGTENLAVSLSLIEVRDLVRDYLVSQDEVVRESILQDLSSHEGNSPLYLSKLIASMKPPLHMPTPKADTIPGWFELSVKGLPGETDIKYVVQLPPEYDPHRRYPLIVTLNGSATTPQQQVEWWAGVYNKGLRQRRGQATRRGYVVVAPHWSQPHQHRYEYSAQEHAAVLFSLRDACRRFSVDTDRVFLSGHSMGGDAVWDIGVAHPDLWAGVIPIVAVADYGKKTDPKYIARYWENARFLPFYFVSGQMDGDKLSLNGRDLDRYMKKIGFDVVVAEYIGRGHEHFSDEIQRLFAWMELHERRFPIPDFSAVTMRPWDNYFWWAELGDLPKRSMVSPFQWPVSNSRPATIVARKLPSGRLSVKTGAAKLSLWLTPDLANFDQQIPISVNGTLRRYPLKPDAKTLLEDVRTRGDRLHPFWAKVDVETGRRN